MYAHQVLIVLIYFLRANSFVLAGNWTQWTDITLCTAKPCKCFNDREICEDGKKVQLRGCTLDDGRVCVYDNEGGYLRMVTCTNERVCPGWSEKVFDKDCHCRPGIRRYTQSCTNPAPIHPDVLCEDPDKIAKMGILTREDQVECVCSIEDINDCDLDLDPCQNGGTCQDRLGGYICLCEDGYTGNDCSINIDDCELNNCENNGTCIDEVNQYRCNCPEEFQGQHCNNKIECCPPSDNKAKEKLGDLERKPTAPQSVDDSIFGDYYEPDKCRNCDYDIY